MSPATEIAHLETFVTAGEAGSIAAAAEKLGTGAASVSRRIRQLEENLGTPLFERTARGLRLTPEGVRFLERAKTILARVADATPDVREFGKSIAGTIRIGLPPIALKTLASGLVSYALNDHPNVMIAFHEGYSWDVRDWLESGKIDIGLFYGSPGGSPAFAKPIASEELNLVGRDVAALEQDGAVALERLFELPLVLPGAPHGHRLQIEELAARERRNLNVAIEVDSLGALLGLIEAGLGYALLPREALPSDAAERGIGIARFREGSVSRVLMMGTSPRRPLSKLTRIFLPVIETLAAAQEKAKSGQNLHSPSYLIDVRGPLPEMPVSTTMPSKKSKPGRKTRTA